MTESARAQQGFKTKVSSATIVTPQEFSGSNTLEKYDQGVYVNSVNSLFGSSVVKMRPNNDFLKVKDGRTVQITEGSFDDTESPTSLGTSSGSFITSYFLTSSFLPYTQSFSTTTSGLSTAIVSLGQGVYDITGSSNSGYAYIKASGLLSASTYFKIKYDYSAVDGSSDDWPFFITSSTEPVGSPSILAPGNILKTPPTASETGQFFLTISTGSWFSLGIKSAGSIAGLGKVRFSIEYLTSGTVQKTIPYYPKSYISMNLFSKMSPGDSATEGTKLSGAKIAPSHYLLDNDFGQADLYQDGKAFEEADSAIDPVRIVSTDPYTIVIPYELVNTTDARLLDGVIDTFDVRKEVDRSAIDVPFRAKGTRGDLVNSDSYRRSYLVLDEVEVFQVRQNSDSKANPIRGTDPFLDSEDQFGIADFFGIEMTDTMTGPVSSIGYVKPPTQTLSPFKDASDVEDVINSFPTGTVPGSLDYEMRAAVAALAGNTTPGHSYLSRNHVSLARGFDYDNSKFGIDSLAYGGLLK